MIEVGEQLGRYKIEGLLGAGGMGRVYRAVDTELQRIVAIKLLLVDSSHDASRYPSLVRRMREEARAVAQFNHPNVVAIHDVGEHEGAPYLVMEFLSGESLRSIVPRRPAIESVMRWMTDVAQALDAAHRKGFVHRDIKPENIMLRDDGVVKILDFGIARRPVSGDDEATSQTKTAEGVIVGTPGYMAPEQIRGVALDARADQFAWAVTTYELLTGVSPWGEGLGAVPLMAAILTEDPVAPRVRNPAIGERVSNALLRALSKDPAARYASMADLLAALGAPAASVADTGNGFLDASRPMAMTDHPLPASSSPEALEAYAAGLQAFRDADWNLAHREFERALSHDRQLAAAQLRFALSCYGGGRVSTERMEQEFKKAISLRTRLTPRDQQILRVLEPWLLFADQPEALRRAIALADKYPGDAEVQGLVVSLGEQLHAADVIEAYARKSVAIDPLYADCWQTLAFALTLRGDTDGAHEALERCLEANPASPDAYMERAYIHAGRGAHERVDADAKRGLSLGAAWNLAPYRASALYALGRPLTVVREALDAALGTTTDSYALLQLETAVPILAGAFDEALAVVDRIAASAKPAPVHLIAELRVRIAAETGREREAGEIARAHLERFDLCPNPTRAWRDPSALLASIALSAGSVDESTAERIQREFSSRWATGGAVTWALGYGPFAAHPRFVDRAMAEIPSSVIGTRTMQLAVSAHAGRLLRAAGRLDEAIAYLRAASRMTMAVADPFLHTGAVNELGCALLEAHDREGAEAAFREVISRWGRASPRSVTADRARAAMA